jgi:hypothetical protein
MSGHHDHAGDRAHAKAQAKWHSHLVQGKKFCTPKEVCNVLNDLDDYALTWRMGFFDFHSWLAGHYSKIPSVSSCHVLEFSQVR